MTALNPHFVVQVGKIRAALDTIDYFQLLRLPYDAVEEEIRAGYHQQARTFHPDRYHHYGNAALVADLTIIAKRIVEAYVVLRDTDKRHRYLANIQGEERAANLRFRESHEGDHREQQEATRGSTPQGRTMYEQAMQARDRGDLRAAVQAMRMALLYEKDNPSFQTLLDQWSEEGS